MFSLTFLVQPVTVLLEAGEESSLSLPVVRVSSTLYLCPCPRVDGTLVTFSGEVQPPSEHRERARTLKFGAHPPTKYGWHQ